MIDWGRATYKKQKGGGKLRNSGATLNILIFQYLGSLIEMGIPMPDPALEHLRNAIRSRKRVGEYHKAIPIASKKDHVQYQWLINQLERLERQFSNQKELEKQNADNVPPVNLQNNRQGFALLFVSDEEEEDQPTELDSGGDNNKESPSIKPQTPTTEELEVEERTFAISLVWAEIAEAKTTSNSCGKNGRPKKKGGEIVIMTTQMQVPSYSLLLLVRNIPYRQSPNFTRSLAWNFPPLLPWTLVPLRTPF